MNMSFRNTVKFKDLTTFAISFDTEQDITLRVSSLPAGPLWEKIRRAVLVDVLRAF
jgi:hypothetical protein